MYIRSTGCCTYIRSKLCMQIYMVKARTECAVTFPAKIILLPRGFKIEEAAHSALGKMAGRYVEEHIQIVADWLSSNLR